MGPWRGSGRLYVILSSDGGRHSEVDTRGLHATGV
jgi:hypothetical protein